MNIDIIGTLYNIYTSDEENPTSVALEGYHVNTTEPIIGAD